MGIRTFPVAGTGGMTLLSTTAITSVASISVASINQTFTNLRIVINNYAPVTNGVGFSLTLNSLTTGIYAGNQENSSAAGSNLETNSTSLIWASAVGNASNGVYVFDIPRYTDTTSTKTISGNGSNWDSTATNFRVQRFVGGIRNLPAITSIQLFPSSGNWAAQGNIYVYGVN